MVGPIRNQRALHRRIDAPIAAKRLGLACNKRHGKVHQRTWYSAPSGKAAPAAADTAFLAVSKSCMADRAGLALERDYEGILEIFAALKHACNSWPSPGASCQLM